MITLGRPFGQPRAQARRQLNSEVFVLLQDELETTTSSVTCSTERPTSAFSLDHRSVDVFCA